MMKTKEVQYKLILYASTPALNMGWHAYSSLRSYSLRDEWYKTQSTLHTIAVTYIATK
jgi:hypothetical protein